MRTHAIRCSTLLPMVLAAMSVAARADEADDTRSLDVIREGYSSNRDAFQSFTCRFKVIEGKADTIEQALKGTVTNTNPQTGVWIVDGPNVRYELSCDAPIIREKPPEIKPGQKGVFAGVSCSPEAILKSGDVKMSYSGLLGGINIMPTSSYGAEIYLTPFSMGVMGVDENRSPARTISDCSTGKRLCRFEGIKDLDNTQVHVFSDRLAPSEDPALKGNKSFHRWFLDPDRGFLPVQSHSYVDPETIYQKLWITDVRRTDQGDYFPARSVQVRYPDKPAPYHVRIIELVELELTKRPPESSFFIDVPGGVGVLNPVDGRASFRMAVAQRIRLHDLPGMIERCEQALQRRIAAGQ